MKYWRVEARDCAGECVGAFSFDNYDAALQCLQWFDSHPLPENEMFYHILVEVEPKLDHYFIPPMSEEEYHQKYDSYLRAIADDADDDPYDDPLI